AAVNAPPLTEAGRLEGHTDGIEFLALSPDGTRALSASRDRSVRLWDVPGRRLLHTLEGHRGGGWCVAVSPAGRRAVSSSDDRTIRVWNLETGHEIHSFPSGGVANSVTFSPD